ncbi:hypothetical protein LSH36_2g00026 [Paralvinella palmiformis]|uniref:Uncharacterized protein n=1 Tax=Paralvinella palmiformis TaxID=53620 RepID=A0AAD9KG66_9ANNE|nr:hypothetical protein LSH36_2g00026 [Paralvinella palmiformis]
MAEYGDMDGLPEGYPVKVIITERDKSRHSFSGQTNDDRYGESRTLISCSIPPTDVMETLMPTAAKPAINEFDGKILQDQAGTAFARETDTRSVTFDSTQYTGHELVDNDDGPERPAPSRRDLCSSELCTSNETLGIDKEIARRNAEATEDILTSGGYSCETNTSGTDFYTIELQRARTNTPTSTYCTDITESKSATKK